MVRRRPARKEGKQEGISVHPWVLSSPLAHPISAWHNARLLLAQRMGWDPGSAPHPQLWNPTLLEAEKWGLVTPPHGDLGK